MKINEFYFKLEFINILIANVGAKGLGAVYNLSIQSKYSVDYIVDVVIAVSTKAYTRYRLPNDLRVFLNQSQYSKYTKNSLKTLVKGQIVNLSENNSIFNTYVVIGHDIPINIKQLSVVLDDYIEPTFTDITNQSVALDV